MGSLKYRGRGYELLTTLPDHVINVVQRLQKNSTPLHCLFSMFSFIGVWSSQIQISIINHLCKWLIHRFFTSAFWLGWLVLNSRFLTCRAAAGVTFLPLGPTICFSAICFFVCHLCTHGLGLALPQHLISLLWTACVCAYLRACVHQRMSHK